VASFATPDRAPASPLKHWSAWLPVATSVFLIALGLRHIASYGLGREADEGTEAHLFQLLMPLQALVIAYFAWTWLPKTPRLAVVVLALQLAAAGAVFALVYRIEHP
jgi:MFS superfamily sulfate permease-like transporter